MHCNARLRQRGCHEQGVSFPCLCMIFLCVLSFWNHHQPSLSIWPPMESPATDDVALGSTRCLSIPSDSISLKREILRQCTPYDAHHQHIFSTWWGHRRFWRWLHIKTRIKGIRPTNLKPPSNVQPCSNSPQSEESQSINRGSTFEFLFMSRVRGSPFACEPERLRVAVSGWI